jgi:hypothetical protein
MDVLEFRLPQFEEGFYLDICSYEQMGSEEGLVVAGSNCIKLRGDVYEGAWDDVGRDRFTACQDAEWQADTFAGGLLKSSKHLARLGCYENAAVQCGMTLMAASVMSSKYQKEGFLQ